eukprot:4016622-Prymnesium_polylepis.2
MDRRTGPCSCLRGCRSWSQRRRRPMRRCECRGRSRCCFEAPRGGSPLISNVAGYRPGLDAWRVRGYPSVRADGKSPSIIGSCGSAHESGGGSGLRACADGPRRLRVCWAHESG